MWGESQQAGTINHSLMGILIIPVKITGNAFKSEDGLITVSVVNVNWRQGRFKQTTINYRLQILFFHITQASREKPHKTLLSSCFSQAPWRVFADASYTLASSLE